MWNAYKEITQKYPKLSLLKERLLISKAKKGSKASANELVLRHVGFVMFRLRRKVFPTLLHRHGEDLLSAALPILYQKIQAYDLRYRDKKGRPKPVKFSSYLWKRIDGFIIDSIKKERLKERMELSGLEFSTEI